MALKDSNFVEELLKDPSKIQSVKAGDSMIAIDLGKGVKLTIFCDDDYKLAYNVFDPNSSDL